MALSPPSPPSPPPFSSFLQGFPFLALLPQFALRYWWLIEAGVQVNLRGARGPLAPPLPPYLTASGNLNWYCRCCSGPGGELQLQHGRVITETCSSTRTLAFRWLKQHCHNLQQHSAGFAPVPEVAPLGVVSRPLAVARSAPTTDAESRHCAFNDEPAQKVDPWDLLKFAFPR